MTLREDRSMTRKKQLSIIITCVFIVCLACVFTTKVNAEGHITRDEWIHKLVTELNLSIDNEIYPDDYYPDIVESEYYDDILIAIKNGLIDLEPGENFEPDKIVTREYTAHMVCSYIGRQLNENDSYTMNDMESLTYPEDDQIAIDSGWFELVNDEFKPEKEIETSEITSIINDIKSSYIMMDIDSNHENSYEYAEGVVEVPDGTEIVISENKIDIVDCPVNIVDDDVFVVYQYGIPCAFKAVDVTVEDDVTSVITEDYDMDGVLINADAEGIIYVEPSMLTPAEDDMTISVIEDNTVNNSKRLAKKVKSTKPLKPYKFKINAGSIGLSGEVSNLCLEYKFIGKDLYIGLKGYLKINASQTVGSKTSVPFFVCEPIVGVQMQVSVDYSINGTAALNYATSFRVGAGYKVLKGKWEAVHTFENDDFTFEAKINAKVGLTARIVAGDGVIFNGSLYASTGLKAELSSVRHLDGSLPKTCTGLEAYAYAEAGYNLKVNILGAPSYNDKISFFDENNPPLYIYYHYEDGQFVDHCTRGITTSSGKKRKYITKPYGGGSKKTISSYIDSGYVTTTDSGTGEVTYKPAYDYTLDDEGNATITKYNGYARYLDIPEYIDGHKVIAIGNRTFEGNTYISVVHIPDDVNEIGYRSFAECTNLYEINLPKGLVRLSEQVFYDDDKIASITIPKSLDECSGNTWTNDVESGFSGPFDHCDGLKDVKFENGVTEISCCLFGGCPGIEEITIPDTVTKIENNGFYQCSNLKKVGMSDTVTEMGYSAFAECPELSEIDLPKGLVKLSEQVFYDDDKIASITIPKSLDECSGNTWTNDVESGFSGPFDHCDGLKDVKFENGVTEISCCLFGGCTGIETIRIPKTVKTIEQYAFMGSGIKTINFNDVIDTIEYSAFADCNSLKEISIPDNVKYIGACVFERCSSLERVKIPNITINILERMFYECDSLVEINLPNTLQTIGDHAFYKCSSLTEIEIPDKVITVCGNAFSDCTSLTKVVIPQSVEEIWQSAFSHCESLTDLTISEGVTAIYSNAFEYNKSLAKVTLPDSLQTLGDYAFQYCDVLSDVQLGAGLKTVPKYCFYEDPELVSVVLPQQMTTVDEFAFGNCTKFTDVTMNRNVTSAAVNAFSYPAKLTIHGVAGTYAEDFASENNIKFAALNTNTTAIKLNKTSLELGRGYSALLTASITPSDSADELTWTSSDEDIVTVDENGKIEGINGGEASIIVMSGDVMETCDVKVYEAVSSVSVSPYSYEGTTGNTVQLEASIYPSNATYQDVTWSSDNDDIATVDSNGLVTLGKYGTATITATTKDMSRKDTCVVTVKDIAVTGVSLNAKNVTIAIGEEKELTATIQPENASNKNVTWTSSKPDVVSVNAGKITALKEGTANIIVKTENGAKTASCTVTVVAEHVHNLIHTDAKESTCKEAGNIEYWTCEGCDKIFADAEGDEEITVEDTIIPKKEHTPSEAVKENEEAATCEEDGSYDEVVKCSVCGEVISSEHKVVPALEHDWGEWIETKPATDTSTGEETRTCKRNPNHKETREIEKSVHVHNLIHTEAKAATCKEAGNIEYWTCEGCDKIFEDEDGKNEITVADTLIPKKEHTPSEVVRENEVAATCENAGSYDEVIKCTACGDVISRDHKVVPALGHDWGEWSVTKAATETSVGEEFRICKHDPSHKETREIAKLQHTHNPSAAIKENVVEATYDKGGSYDEVIKCTVCGEVLSRKTITTNALQSQTKPVDTTKPVDNTTPATQDNNKNVVAKEEGTPLSVPEEKAEVVVTSKAGETPTVEYKSTNNSTMKNVSIPSEVNVEGVTYQVTEIADNAFMDNKNIESVVISANVEIIGENAFSNCTKLKNVVISNSVEVIEKNAFSGCKSLEKVELTDNIKEVGDGTFLKCVKLKKVILGKNTTKVGKNAFKGCKSLKTIVVKSTKLTNKSFGKNAFNGINKKATFKCPKKQFKNYKKWIKKAGAPKTAKYKK